MATRISRGLPGFFPLRHRLVPIIAALGILAPRLVAQQSDSTRFAVGRLVERAQRIAERGDTIAFQNALAVLDSAERMVRAGAIFRTRAIVGVSYGESLLARARITVRCVDVRRAAEVIQLADRAMPSDDRSNSPGLLQAGLGHDDSDPCHQRR